MTTGGSSSFDLVFPCFFLITRRTEGHIYSLVVEKIICDAGGFVRERNRR